MSKREVELDVGADKQDSETKKPKLEEEEVENADDGDSPPAEYGVYKHTILYHTALEIGKEIVEFSVDKEDSSITIHWSQIPTDSEGQDEDEDEEVAVEVGQSNEDPDPTTEIQLDEEIKLTFQYFLPSYLDMNTVEVTLDEKIGKLVISGKYKDGENANKPSQTQTSIMIVFEREGEIGVLVNADGYKGEGFDIRVDKAIPTIRVQSTIGGDSQGFHVKVALPHIVVLSIVKTEVLKGSSGILIAGKIVRSLPDESESEMETTEVEAEEIGV